MSSETAPARKKRTASEANLASEVDHRKRRRNRTTQSCLNCHTSKRMCDRKRPACARCTQLGLTGLCVYEVDDPNQRTDSQDESARLLKRVAELEGVIRELKNKPHPRWVHATNGAAAELEKWASRSRSHLRTTSEPGHIRASGAQTVSASSLSHKAKLCSPRGRSARSSSVPHIHPPTIILDTSDRRPSQTASSSPQSTPSPGLITPTDEFSPSHVTLPPLAEVSHEYDLASMFLSYPNLMGCDPVSFGSLGKEHGSQDSCYVKQNVGNCGCLHEAASYNMLLELSLRLRRATDVLARSASHRMGHQCHLQQRISELDVLTTNALGGISTPPDDLPVSTVSRSDASQPSLTNSLQLHASQSFAQSGRTTISPESLQTMRPWDLLPSVVGSPTMCEDSFMTWEPARRP